ncbi:hypothetical protein N8755_00845 [Alphaproteobacteria bacterium]|nr:hypothetical protein [Alphaproteobacteria bacterium]
MFQSDNPIKHSFNLHVLISLFFILFVSLMHFYIKTTQWNFWNTKPEIYFFENSPMLTSKDAGYFLGIAEDYKYEESSFSLNRNYPENLQKSKENTGLSWHNIPMLSFILAHIVDYVKNKDFTLAGNLLIPFAIFLSVLSIGIMFWVAGYPLEGSISALGTGLSPIIIQRTEIGRIDTDMLILFFLGIILSSFLITLKQKSFKNFIILSIISGIVSFLFLWWYDQKLFLVILPPILGLMVFLNKKKFSWALVSTLILIIILNPINYFNSVLPVIKRTLNMFGISNLEPIHDEQYNINLYYPDTFDTIDELIVLGFSDQLFQIIPIPILSILGILGFSLWIFLKVKERIIFFPFFVLGISSFYIGYRFSFYAVPFVWFGVTWLTVTSLTFLVKKLKLEIFKKYQTPVHILICTIHILVILLTFYPKIDETRPIISAEIIKTLNQLEAYSLRNNDLNPVIATWWDYGYVASFKTNMATFHDGGSQRSPKTYLIAQGLTNKYPLQLVKILDLISSGGNDAIFKASNDTISLQNAIVNAENTKNKIYILVTGEMSLMMPMIAKLGRHDIVKNVSTSNKMIGSFIANNPMCEEISNNSINCEGDIINFQNGTFNNDKIIREIVTVSSGNITGRKLYHKNGKIIIALDQQKGGTSIKIIHSNLWDSVFYQLMERGEYIENTFSLIIDNYPHARVYEIIR